MNSQPIFDEALAVRLVETLGHFLWQGAALGLLAAGLCVLLRKRSARTRHALLVGVLFAMALCPLLTFGYLGIAEPAQDPVPVRVAEAEVPGGIAGVETPAIARPAADEEATVPIAAGLPELEEEPAAASVIAEAEAEVASSRPRVDWRRYAPHAALAYVLGVAVMLLRLLVAVGGGQRLRRRSEPVTDGRLLEAFGRHAAALGLRYTPPIAACARVAVPTVVGVIRPAILVPLSVLSGLSPGQIDLLLLHELAHIRRLDPVLNLVQRVVEALLFFHPAVWYVSHRIRVERENCCDDLVLAHGGNPHTYARSLVDAAALAKGLTLSPAAVAATGRPSQLRARVARLLGAQHPPLRLRRTGLAALAVAPLGEALRLEMVGPASIPSASAQALARLGTDSAVEQLHAALIPTSGAVPVNTLEEIVRAIGQIDRPAAAEALVDLLDGTIEHGSEARTASPGLAMAAAEVLAERGDARAEPTLREMAEEPDTYLRAQRALMLLREKTGSGEAVEGGGSGG